MNEGKSAQPQRARRSIYGKENTPKKTLNIEEKLKNIGENKSKNKTENKEEKDRKVRTFRTML